MTASKMALFVSGANDNMAVELPLRVIDIPATLATTGGICLCKPSSWDFHILSHTWSADIRELSKEIGSMVAISQPTLMPRDATLISDRNQKDGAGVEEMRDRAMAYNAAFENADFGGSQAYESLRELLLLLVEDGVTRLWLDALCIDQTSTDEKSREISRMANYYHLSQGCYVLVFGVGRGYGLWSDVTQPMPRWFQRVWTLQEFLLPTKLTFVVEALDERLLRMVEGLSSTSWPNSRLGFCKCGVPADLLEFDPPSIHKILQQQQHWKEAPPISRLDVVDSVDGLCPRCGKGMLLRGPVSCINGKQIHFIDRDAYLFIVRASIAIYIGRGSTNKKDEEKLCGLFGILEAAKVDPRLIILKIGERFCSHAEDRVLSILGLLGVSLNNDEQLRTGKTLHEQIIEAAQKCDPSTLVLLFATDGVGYPTKGMSWAPNFCDSWESLICGWNDNSHCRIDRDTHKKEWIGGIQDFRREMGVLGVSAAGVRVACKKVTGYVRAIREEERQDRLVSADVPAMTIDQGDSHAAATHALFCSTYNDECAIMSMAASTWMFDSVPSEKGDADHLKCRAVDGKFQIIHLVSTSDNHSRLSVTVATGMLPPHANMQAARDLARLDVCMVLLGCIEEDGTDLIMVCLEEQGELHKIGILVLPSNQSCQIFANSETEECVIGGFGKDLSRFVKLQGFVNSNGAGSDAPENQADEERLYLVCKGLLCPPMGGPAVPQGIEFCKAVQDRLPIPSFHSGQTSEHLRRLKHL